MRAPLPGGGDRRIPWPDGCRQVLGAFSASYPALHALARQAVDSHWIDHQPRPGKRPGGFCSSSSVVEQSRIFLTYGGAMGDVQTLAHELGHAFHGSLLRGMRPWAREYPMTLAETASTFAEELVTDAMLRSPETTAAERATILDQRLQKAEAFLLNIPMRLDFEVALYERRIDGELTVPELCELMSAAQRDHYGDALAGDGLDPWFWASKLHYYLTDISFYNFPYTFGYLFSLGIAARARREGEAFLATYEELLRRTGSAAAEDLARELLGVDLTEPAFWHSSMDLIAADLEDFAGGASAA
jgi:oligoendopeptidase F